MHTFFVGCHVVASILLGLHCSFKQLISNVLTGCWRISTIRKWLKEATMERKNWGSHVKEDKNYVRNRCKELPLHFPWGHTSRKQAVPLCLSLKISSLLTVHFSRFYEAAKDIWYSQENVFRLAFELQSSLSKCFAKDYLTLKLFRIWLNGVLSAASASRIFMNRLVRFEYIIIIIMQKKLCMTEGLFSFFAFQLY